MQSGGDEKPFRQISSWSKNHRVRRNSSCSTLKSRDAEGSGKKIKVGVWFYLTSSLIPWEYKGVSAFTSEMALKQAANIRVAPGSETRGGNEETRLSLGERVPGRESDPKHRYWGGRNMNWNRRRVSSETRIAKISRQSDCHQLVVSVLEGAHLWHGEHEWKPLVIAALSGNRRQLKPGQECVRDKCRQFKDILKWLN